MVPIPDHVRLAIKPVYDRVTPRMDTWCVGEIQLDSGHLRECVVIDLSETGARIRFRTRGKLTGIITLKASRYRINRRARVVWKDMYDAGLEFVDVDQQSA